MSNYKLDPNNKSMVRWTKLFDDLSSDYKRVLIELIALRKEVIELKKRVKDIENSDDSWLTSMEQSH